MRLLKVLCVIALVFVVATVAYAETQSVKVSGDIALRTFARNNYDLDNDDVGLALTAAGAIVSQDDATAAAGTDFGGQSTDWATYLLSTIEVQVDADLTDNVSAVIRLVNQRVWGNGVYTSSGDETGLLNIPFRDQVASNIVGPAVQQDAFGVGVDLAYIELKEFLYSPLTLKIGRQDIWFGRGFIIGANQLETQDSIFCPEYTAINSFDAIRGTLDYAPWTIDMVFAKIGENWRRADDDVNLWGVNVGYVFDNYNAEAEAYWFMRQSRYTGSNAAGVATLTDVTSGNNSNDIHTVGGRGSFDPIEDWTVALEGAYQFGQYIGIADQVNDRDRSAWACDIMLECRYFQDNFAWRPVLQGEYIYYSGEENQANTAVGDSDTYTGWDFMFRGKYDTAIREFQNVYYRTNSTSTPSTTNQHQFLLSLEVEPTDSLTVGVRGAYFLLDEDYSTTGANPNTENSIGGELDVQVTWDYTEDVTFGLLTGFFFPGDHFINGQDDVATDIVGSVKLSF